MKQTFFNSFKIYILTLCVLSALLEFSNCFVHIELKKSSAKYKSEYLKSLKFFQKSFFKEFSSFLEEKEITLHQQV